MNKTTHTTMKVVYLLVLIVINTLTVWAAATGSHPHDAWKVGIPAIALLGVVWFLERMDTL